MNTPAVEFSKVSKRFILRYDRPRSFQELLINFPMRGGKAEEELWALKDVSFQVARGEMQGIVGPNGAGKSTLLKLVARILKPTSGRITANGRVSSLLELGAGFHPDLTGRENIYLQGSILGLSRKEVRSKFDDIVAFSELGRFIDLPLKHYSTGMYMRLGFALAVHVEPEILLIDEILAVGDEPFQAKCYGKIDELRDKGITIILVSHNLGAIRALCNSAIWLHEGELRDQGNVDKVIDSYLNHIALEEGISPRERPEGRKGRRWGSKEIEITKVTILDAEGQERHLFKTGEGMTIRMEYFAHKEVEQPVFGVAIYRDDGLLVYGVNGKLSNCVMERASGIGAVECQLESIPLFPGRYEVSAAAYDYNVLQAYDHHDRLYLFSIVSEGGYEENQGMVSIPCKWNYYKMRPDRDSRALPG